ncbi:uncharacterized protein BDR25DRAFT_397204, partial [Lindgomyces ingoldianus]
MQRRSGLVWTAVQSSEWWKTLHKVQMKLAPRPPLALASGLIGQFRRKNRQGRLDVFTQPNTSQRKAQTFSHLVVFRRYFHYSLLFCQSLVSMCAIWFSGEKRALIISLIATNPRFFWRPCGAAHAGFGWLPESWSNSASRAYAVAHLFSRSAAQLFNVTRMSPIIHAGEFIDNFPEHGLGWQFVLHDLRLSFRSSAGMQPSWTSKPSSPIVLRREPLAFQHLAGSENLETLLKLRIPPLSSLDNQHAPDPLNTVVSTLDP